MTSEEYAAIGGVRCPVCGSYDIEGGSVEIDAGGAYQKVVCNACSASWEDKYTLTGFTSLETGG